MNLTPAMPASALGKSMSSGAGVSPEGSVRPASRWASLLWD